ncbi:MAG: MotA/TolQ/ExbB proton channel family protein [Puniceicoccales bacterium]|jgi:biopolymer transport protein ExbB|nr:MotA/TolQ/ExbB proton channel family protein [Puniceicoccales bacterium]
MPASITLTALLANAANAVATTAAAPEGQALLAGEGALGYFKKGGPIMWPILLVSFVTLAVIIERLLFLAREKFVRNPHASCLIYERVEKRDIEGAVRVGATSRDFVARILVNALTHRDLSLEDAFAQASSKELARYQQGIPILDTCITAAPLLGLLGTVTGMIGTFNSLNGTDIAASAGGITGGVGEALIATTCGLAIAIAALFPFNVLNARVEQVRADIANAASALNLAIQKANGLHTTDNTIADPGAGI